MGMIGNQAGFASATSVSDTPNASTGAFDVPSGTTAQRPASPSLGYLRFNTELDCMENYTSTGWLKVSVPVPALVSANGELFAGVTSTITLSGTSFGSGAGVVRFTSGGVTKDVAATPSSSVSVSVAVPSEIFALTAGTSVLVKFTNSDGGQSNTITKTVIAPPSGGVLTTSGGYRYHTFKSNDNFVNTVSGLSVEYLIVAGGGGSRSTGPTGTNPTAWDGGGGAGGLLNGSTVLSAGTNGISIGGGGAVDSSGTNTTALGLTAIGGGCGGYYSQVGVSGGSGGGGGGDLAMAGGAGTAGQGYAGGTACDPTPEGGGGGGGAGAVGAQGLNAGTGAGGIGRDFSTWATATSTGASGYFAGGGGGGCGTVNSPGTNIGGLGGGGTGSQYNYSTGNTAGNGATNGTAYTGGGAGGGSRTGGSGIVIIRYQL